MSYSHSGEPLEAQYGRLKEAILSVIEVSESAWRLGPLDEFLIPWARDELLHMSSSLSWSDSTLDLELIYTGVARHGVHYAELRRQLFSDLNQCGPEPVWRRVGAPFEQKFAVRAQSHVYQQRPSYLLRRKSFDSWDLVVITRAEANTYPVYVTSEADKPNVLHIQAPDLYDRHLQRRDAYEQLDHGFRCLGFVPFLKL